MAFVHLTKKGAFGTNVPLARSYGSIEVTSQASLEPLPLRDGASNIGSLGKWLTYKFVLRKLS